MSRTVPSQVLPILTVTDVWPSRVLPTPKRCEVLSGLHKANLSWQTGVGKLKLVCVNGTKTVLKHVGKLIATNRTCLYSRQLLHQLFRVGKLVSEVWTIGTRVLHVLVTVNQLKHALYSRDLFALHFTKWRTQIKMKVKPHLIYRRGSLLSGCVGRFVFGIQRY